MAFPALFTQAQLEVALGGADKLVQLAKASSSSDPVLATFLAEVQAAASGNVYAILQVAFDPNDPNFAAAQYVQQNAVTIGVYWAWHKSTGGTAVPDEVKAAKVEAERELDNTREGLRSLGSDMNPASNAGAEGVNLVTSNRRIMRRNTGGFC
jgi:hypothetical protein